MELRPGYKQTEVGVIPEDWNVVHFSELLEFRNGVNADKDAYGKGTPFVNVLEIITKGHLSASDIPGKVSLTKRAIDSYAVCSGDLLFNRTSETQEEVGLTAVYLDDEPVVFGGFVIRGRPTTRDIDATFSGYAFRAPSIRSQIVARGQGAIRANIGQSDLRQILIALPKLPEQRAIATALSDMDALIGALDRLIAKKRDLKQAAMQQLLTGQTRLPGFSGKWKVKLLGEVLDKIVGGGTPSRLNPSYWGNEIPWVTVKDFATFHPYQTQETITPEGLKQSASNLIPKGTLITSTRMALGKAVIYKVDVSINQDLKALFPKQCINKKFLYYWFEFHASAIDDLGSGSTVKGISLADIKAIRFDLASLDEQIAIATILSDMDAEIAALEARQDKTRALKQGMTQELLTGGIRLM